MDLSTFPIIAAALSLLDFTTVATTEHFILLSPWPEEESRLTAVIRPFNFTVHNILKMMHLKAINYYLLCCVHLPLFDKDVDTDKCFDISYYHIYYLIGLSLLPLGKISRFTAK